MDANSLDLELSLELRDKIDDAIYRLVVQAVEDCSERDDILLDLRAQNEGESASLSRGPWKDSCKLEDSISREMHTTMIAALRQARKFPYYLIEPTQPGDSQISSDVERWLNNLLRTYQYDRVLDNLAYTCLESLYAPLFVGWKRVTEKVTGLGSEDANDERGDQLWQEERLRYEGLDFRTPDPWNVYVSPSSAISFRCEDPGGADGIIERLWVTKNDLYAGIQAHGYDRESVMDILRTQANVDTRTGEVLDRLGVEQSDAIVPIYIYIGRLPLLLGTEDEVELPEYLQRQDFLWIVCPERSKTLKRSFSPYAKRPYCAFRAFNVPNSILGHGILSFLTTIQNEMTATLRLAMDNMTLCASAPFMVPESHIHRYGNVEFGPGRTIATPNNGLMQQLRVDPMGAQLALEFQQYLYGRASQIAAAQSVNSMLGGKVRKAAEVEFTANIVQTKFDLVVANFQRGMEDAIELILSTVAMHLSDDGSIVSSPNMALSVLADETTRRFRFIPQVSSDNLNSQVRLARDESMVAILRQSPLYMARMQAGDMSGEYQLMTRVLQHMNEPDPQSLLGPDPTQEAGMMGGADAGPGYGQMDQDLPVAGVDGGYPAMAPGAPGGQPQSPAGL
jgi:hypothetical protein